MIQAHAKVVETGHPNFLAAKVLLPSRFNFNYLERVLEYYPDKIIIELLKYGFPLAHNGKSGSKSIPKNHKGARNYPSQMEEMLKKEVQQHAVIGPFDKSPFGTETYLSPLNLVPKKDSSKRRLILDLSYPEGNSINDGIRKDEYLGVEEKLTLPSVDQLTEQIAKIGRGARVFKIDLVRGYRQFYICPSAINWLGYMYKGKFYFDCTLSMGSRSSARCCERVTSAVVFIFKTKYGHFAINYLDDIGAAESEQKAAEAFEHLREILKAMGLQEAVEKTVPPCTVMVFLGIQVNTVELTLTIPLDKWQEIKAELLKWEQKSYATLKDTQKLAGLLNLACRCVRSGRIYLSQILNFLRTLPKFGTRKVTEQVKADVAWWLEFAEKFNGVSLIPEPTWSDLDWEVSSDSCLSSGGGFAQGKFFSWQYPEQITQLEPDINQIECLNVVMCLKLWAEHFNRKKIKIFCDNTVTVQAINSGNSRCKGIQRCLREIHKITAWHSFQIQIVYLEGKNNRISDTLSRFHLDAKHRDEFMKLTRNWEVEEFKVKKAFYEFF